MQKHKPLCAVIRNMPFTTVCNETAEPTATARQPGKLPEQGCSDRVGGISLVLIVLDDYALLEQGGVLSVMLVAVVRVDGMRHVSTDQEAILDGALYSALLALRQNASYSMNGVLHHRPSSPCKTDFASQGYNRGVTGAPAPPRGGGLGEEGRLEEGRLQDSCKA